MYAFQRLLIPLPLVVVVTVLWNGTAVTTDLRRLVANVDSEHLLTGVDSSQRAGQFFEDRTRGTPGIKSIERALSVPKCTSFGFKCAHLAEA